MQTQQQSLTSIPHPTHTHTHTHTPSPPPNIPLSSPPLNNQNISQITQPTQQQQKQLLESYFKPIQKKYRNRHAQTLGCFIEQSIFDGIQNGDVDVCEEKGSIEKILFESRVRDRESKEDKVKREEEEEEKRRMMIEMHLKYLDRQVSGGKRSKQKQKDKQQQNQFNQLQNYTAVLSKKQHQQFLQKLSKQRQQLQNKKKQQTQKIKQKQTEQQKHRLIVEQQQIKRQKQEKKKKILEKLQEQKKIHQQKIKDQEENNRRLSEVKNKKFLYEKLEEKYQTEIFMPSLEEKKKKLKEIREMSKNFNVEDINNHEKEYIKRREEVLSTSQAKRQKEQWHYKVPEKSQKMAKLLEEQSLQAKLKLEQKKRKLEQKIQRQQQFVTYLKQRFPPTIDPKKRQEIQQRLRLKSQTKQQKPDGKTLGINYLQQVKNQRKKSANSQMQFQRKPITLLQQQPLNKKSQTNYLKTRKPKQYSQIRDRRIQKLISSQNTDRSQKIMKLQIQANKLVEEQRRKQQILKYMKSNGSNGGNGGKKNMNDYDEEDVESTNLLLASIKAKMGIIDLYNKE